MDGRTDGKPRRKAVRAEGGMPSRKGKHTITLPAETSRRLAVHAACEGVTQSEIVARLIDAHCRRWVVADRGDRGEAPSPGGGEGHGGGGGQEARR